MEEIAHPIEPKSLKPATGFGRRIEDEKSEDGEETPAIVNRS
jgi:hypothetical protein